MLKNTHILSKAPSRCFQNEEFALYISKINEGMKVGIYRNNSEPVSNYLNVMYCKDLLLFSCLVFYYCNLLFFTTVIHCG